MTGLLIGTEGNDTLAATEANTVILGFGGEDSLLGSAGIDMILGGTGADSIFGDGAAPVTDDPATHLGGNDMLLGGAGDDLILGGGGNDFILGEDGNDLIAGGFGTDIMHGGPGVDVFAFGIVVAYAVGTHGAFFSSVVDTGLGAGQRDLVLDFTQGEDRIDLSRLDFFQRVPPNDIPFTFIGTAPFSGRPDTPEVRYEVQGDHTIIQLDGVAIQYPTSIPPDGQADAEIELAGAVPLTGQDFIL